MKNVVVYSIVMFCLFVQKGFGAISGTTLVCPNSTQSYTAATVIGAVSYTWSLPGSWSGNSNNSTINITFNTSPGIMTVTAYDNTNTLITQTLSIKILSPQPIPGVIGSVAVCPGQPYTYSVPAYPGAQGYSWNFPGGWNQGSGGNVVNVTPGGASGIVSVQIYGACTFPITQTLGVTVIQPPTALSINGNIMVCPNSTNSYTATLIPGATYVWTLPGGWTGTSTTHTISITTNSNPGSINVVATNPCGNVIGQNLSVGIYTPQTGLTVSGSPTICPNSTNNYTASPVTGATGYTWTLPGGWTGTSTTKTISITSNTLSGTVTVSAVDICGVVITQTLSIQVNTILPPVIQGSSVICQGVSVFYMAACPGIWSTPAGWTSYPANSGIYNGISTTPNATSGVVSATLTDACSAVYVLTMAVTVVPPQQSLTILGNATICPGSINIYTATGVSSVTSYIWFTSTGIAWPTPLNTYGIQTNTGPITLSVQAYNACGTTSQTLQISVLSQSSVAISGPTVVCPNSTNVYSCMPVVGIVGSYSWTLPNGWQGTSNTNTISTISTTSAGIISVSATNFCGAVITQTLQINVQATPSLTIQYSWNFCPGAANNFVLSTIYLSQYQVPGATSYTWTFPTGWPVTYSVVPNSGGNWILGITSGTGSGIISASAVNNCGAVETATLIYGAYTNPTLTVVGNTSVCPGTINVYSALPQQFVSQTAPASYTWALPNGWTGTSSDYTINISNITTSGVMTVSALTYCGFLTTQTLAVNAATPQVNLTISGNTAICPNSVNVYTATNMGGNGSCNWLLPAGWTGYSGSNIISVTTNASPGTLTVMTVNNCGNTFTQTLAVGIYTPQTNLAISGSSVVCSGYTFTYTAGAVNCASSYTWALPSGWTGTSNTRTIAVTVNNSPGTITVTAKDCCGNLITQTLTTTMYTAPGSLGVTGPTLICISNGNYTFSATPIGGASSYTWTLPSGWTGTSSTNTIHPTNMNSGGIISVSAISACGTLITQTLAVTQFTVIYASAVYGPTLVCPGSIHSYSCNLVPATTSYSWTEFISGWTSPPGPTNTVVTFPASTTNTMEILYAEATDICGFKQNAILYITVAITQTNLTVGGNTLVCPGSSNSYTAGSVIGASSYTWSLPATWTGAASTSTLKTITVGSGPGTITVTALNYCGVLITQTIAVNIIPTQTGLTISGNTILCPNTANTYVASLVNGATSYTWALPAGWLPNPASTTNTLNVTSGPVPATLSVSAYNSCGILVTQTLVINPVPPIGLSVSQTSLSFCSNSPVSATLVATTTLTAVPVSIIWMPGTIINATAVINPTATTIYTVFALVPGGCVTAQAQVTVNVTTNCCAQSTVGMQTIATVTNGNFFGGPFLINQNVTLNGSTLFSGEFIIMPNVQITVPNGVQFYMRSAHLYACGTNMWQGINVQNGGSVIMSPSFPPNFIEDAITAVNINNISSQPAINPITADGTLFNKNYIAINISNAPSIASLPIDVRNCVFTSRTISFTSTSWPNTSTLTPGMRYAVLGATLSLASPYLLQNFGSSNLKAPYSSQTANTGINILNVGNGLGAAVNTGVDMGFANPVKEEEFNVFDNVGNGFEIVNGNLSTMNNVFQNMQRITTASGISGGYGIKDSVTTSSLMNPRLKLSPVINGNQSTSSGNRFWNCYIGIRATNVYNLDLSYALFRSSQVIAATPPSSSFLQGNTGIFLRTNRLDYTIQLSEFNNLTNGINIDFVPGSYNMGSAGNGVYAANLVIDQNYFGAQINSTASTSGAFMSDAIKLNGPNSSTWTYSSQGLIRSNKINRVYRGVSVSGMNGYGTIVEGNRISLLDEIALTTPPLRQYGVRGISTPNGLYVLSNTLSAVSPANTNVALIYFRSNSGAILQCNTISDSYKAMEFEGANALAWRGNTMQNHTYGLYFSTSGSFGQQGFASVNDNQWLGFWPFGTYHTFFDNTSSPWSSQLRVRNNLPTFVPTSNGGSPGYTAANFSAVNNPNPYNCPNLGLPSTPSQRSWQEEDILSANAVIQNSSFHIKVFPNPSSGNIFVSSELENEELSIRVLDVAGKEVYSGKMNSSDENKAINLSSFSNGIYVIEIENTLSEKMYKKFILAR